MILERTLKNIWLVRYAGTMVSSFYCISLQKHCTSLDLDKAGNPLILSSETSYIAGAKIIMPGKNSWKYIHQAKEERRNAKAASYLLYTLTFRV